MDFKTQGEEIVKRIHEATIGFQSTFQPGKIYNDEDRLVKNEWVMKIEQAKHDFVLWRCSIPKIR